MSEVVNREELIKGEDMEKALSEAAEIKKSILTTYKDRGKTNYEQFYETALRANEEVNMLMAKRKKDRTDADNELIKKFRKDTARSYKMTCELITPEDVEDGKQTKIEKLADRISLVAYLLRYLGAYELENELARRGVSLTFKSLENSSPVWADENVKENVKNIFEAGKKLRQDIDAETQKFTENIFALNVPQALVYEKESNPVGLKKSDWTKLVDIKVKLMMAKEAEQKEKAETQANDLAEEKQFDQERAKLMQAKLMTMDSEQA